VSRRHIAQPQRIAADVDRHVGDRVFGDAHRGRQVGGRLLQRRQFIAELLQFGLGRFGIERLKLLRRRRAGRQAGTGLLVRPGHKVHHGLAAGRKQRIVFGLQGAGLRRRQQILVPAGDLGVLVHRPRALEHAGQAVVVGRVDGVELVIVATGAAQGQPQERPAERVNLLVDDVHPHLGLVHLGQHLGPQRQEARGDQQFVPLVLVGRGEQVAGKLLDHKTVERLVAVQRVHDVVAISPGVAVGDVFVEAVGVGVTGHIQPVAAPTLAVRGRGQQPLDEPRVRIRTFVGQKGLDLLRSGGQAGQVERDAANDGSLIGRHRRREARRFEPSQDEAVHRRLRPGAIVDVWQRLVGGRLEGPVLRIAAGGTDGQVFRIGCAHLDPTHQDGNLLVGELAVRRHLQGIIRVSHGTHQPALVGPAGHQGWAVLATRERRSP
jgi:hypothetical protein